MRLAFDRPALTEDPWDAVIVGAGPAGSVAARDLARRGRRVLLVERSRMPRYKVCGGCLNARALGALTAAGLEQRLRAAGARRLSLFRVAANGRCAGLRLPGGIAISRLALDAALAEAARDAGATVIEGVTALPEKLSDDKWSVRLRSAAGETRVGARACVIASGLNAETLRALPGVDVRVAAAARIGAGVLLDEAGDAYAPGVIDMAVHRGGYVGLVRVEKNRLNVAAAFDTMFVREQGGPGPAASAVLRASGLAVPEGLSEAPWRGTPPLTRHVAPVAGPRFVLIGDAAGYAEPFTGEGMAWALDTALSASALVDAHLETWDPQAARAWSRRHAACVGPGQRRCRIIAAALRRPGLVASAARLLQAAPGLAAPVMRALNQTGVRKESAV